MPDMFDSYPNLDDILNYKYHKHKKIDKTTYMLHDLLVKADKYVKKKKKYVR